MTHSQQVALVNTILNALPHCRLIAVYGFYLTTHATETTTIDIAISGAHTVKKRTLKVLQRNISERIQRHVSIIDLAKCSKIIGYQVLTDGHIIHCGKGLNCVEQDPISLYYTLMHGKSSPTPAPTAFDNSYPSSQNE